MRPLRTAGDRRRRVSSMVEREEGRRGSRAPRAGKEMGAAPTAPQGQSQATPAGWPLEKGTLYSLALNSIWNLRGSVTEAA